MYQLAVRHKSNGTVAVLAWRRSFACFQYIPIIAFLAEKSNFFVTKIFISAVMAIGYLFLMWQRLSRNRALNKMEILTSSGDGL